MSTIGGKKVLGLKHFIIRAEVIGLFRDFLRLGRIIQGLPKRYPPIGSKNSGEEIKTLNPSNVQFSTEDKVQLRKEWNDWVRAEFRLRANLQSQNFNMNSTTENEEQVSQYLLAQGKRQLQEMERSILIAHNRAQ